MKVFISSTSRDLVAHRDSVADVLEWLDLKSGRMEVFGARAAEPLATCIAEVTDCELFVGIYANRYGSIPTNSTKSITELEYDHAVATQKDIFVFIAATDATLGADSDEPIESKGRLNRFLDQLRSRHVVETFRTPDNLASKVATAIGRHLLEKEKRRSHDRHANALELSITRDDDEITIWATNAGTHVVTDIEVSAIPEDEDWFPKSHGLLPPLCSNPHRDVELTYPIAGGWFYARIPRLSPQTGVGLGTYTLASSNYSRIGLDLFWNDHAGMRRKSFGSADLRDVAWQIPLEPRAE